MSFPVDWDEWRREWQAWLSDHEEALRPTRDRLPGKNFLADEILGTWSVNGQTVELSEVTFPNLSERHPVTGRLIDKRVRGIGITVKRDGESHGLGVAHSFAELEEAIGIA